MVLGGSFSQEQIALTEDVVAAIFAQTVLRNLGRDLLRRVRIIPGTGDGNLKKIGKCYPDHAGQRLLALVFDGDLHNDQAALGIKSLPVHFLPGTVSPETLLRQAASNPGDAARALGLDAALYAATMSGSLEHHDWLDQVCTLCADGKPGVVAKLTTLWLEKDSNRRAAQAFVHAFAEAVGV